MPVDNPAGWVLMVLLFPVLWLFIILEFIIWVGDLCQTPTITKNLEKRYWDLDERIQEIETQQRKKTKKKANKK